MSHVKLVLRPSNRKSDNTVAIAIRITKDRKSRFIYTGEYVKEKDWDKQLGKVKSCHPNSARLNSFLLNKLSKAHDVALEYKSGDVYESISEVKNKLLGKQTTSFFDVAVIVLDNLKKAKRIAQYRTDKGRVAIFKSFVGKSSISFQEVNVTLLQRFQNYLIHKRKIQPRTAINYMITIRTIYNYGIQQLNIDRRNYPFGKGKIQIKFTESKKVGLNKEEVLLLEQATELSHAQQHALNVWLISFYFAGIRMSDVIQLRWSDFKDGRLYYRMNKNDKLVSLKIPEKAQGILDHYSEFKSDIDDFVFPELRGVNTNDQEFLHIRIKTVNRTFNKHLKAIAQKLNIDKKLSMHIARHTFGNISGGTIPIQMLQKLYRHSSITTTINYQQNFIHDEADEALDSVINF